MLSSLNASHSLRWVQGQEDHRIAPSHHTVAPPQHRARQDPCLSRQEHLLHERQPVDLWALVDVRRIGRQPEVQILDIAPTLLWMLGLDHEQLTVRHDGRDERLTDVAGTVVREVFDG